MDMQHQSLLGSQVIPVTNEIVTDKRHVEFGHSQDTTSYTRGFCVCMCVCIHLIVTYYK